VAIPAAAFTHIRHSPELTTASPPAGWGCALLSHRGGHRPMPITVPDCARGDSSQTPIAVRDKLETREDACAVAGLIADAVLDHFSVWERSID
jgi:hypothetical protein